ncbi:MAG: hypothetical protein CAF41_001065 [Nitrospira sp. CG24A]|nr:MAG: hypothetical protein CAF41_001065 [Nitrospira sp. CG24A]
MRVYWKWVLLSVPNLLCGLLMLLSTVTPRHARSNVEAWFQYFGIEDIPSWLADKSIDSWIYWIAFAGFCVGAIHLYLRPNLKHGKLSVVICEGEPWVQVDPGIDESQTVPTAGKLYTYRIALINRDDVPLRNVEVKLMSLEKTPQNFSAVGNHLKLRHDRVGSTNFNVHPTKDPQYLDAMFVDVFSFFVGHDGSSSLRLTSVPEDASCRIPVGKYEVKIMATSERGEMAVAEMAFIPHPEHIPDFRLLNMQSFPGSAYSSS